MDKDELKKFVNQIFKKKGFPPVKNFGKEFADGSKFKHWIRFNRLYCFIVLFVKLFNIMYDEKIDLKLQTSALAEDRLYNWSRINCKFCMFSYNFVF